MEFRRTIMAIACFVIATLSYAYDVEVDGIYYNLVTKAKTAEVTNGNASYNNYSGIVSIPSRIKVNGVYYDVTAIGENAFFCSYTLTSVIIPKSVTNIGDFAFNGCTGLKTIKIPDSVASIGICLFQGCSELRSCFLPNSITCIEYCMFESCSNLKSISIPDSVKEIEMSAFHGCSSLTSISIPNSVTSIGGLAFHGCTSLNSVILGNSVKYIDSAFQGCRNLESVYCYAEKVPSTDSDAFKDSYIKYCTLYVPVASLDAYKAKVPWSTFGTIKSIESEGQPEEAKKCAAPVLTYSDGKLSLSCETEGASFVTDIQDTDIKKHYDNSVNLSATYNITAYATLSGYENSDTITATLCWLDTTPKGEGDIVLDGVSEAKAQPVLIQSVGNTLNLSNISEDATTVEAYTISGLLLDRTVSHDGKAQLTVSGEIVVVKIGNKSVKVKTK